MDSEGKEEAGMERGLLWYEYVSHPLFVTLLHVWQLLTTITL